MLLKRLSILGLFALLSSCSGVPDSELVAKVNGEGITKKEFDETVERNMARYKGQGHELPPGIETRIKESVLRRMIDDKVIALKAQTLGIEITNEELDAKFKEHKDRFRTPEAFDDYLKRSGNTAENMKDDLKRNLLRDRVVEKLSGTVDVVDDEITKYYNENLQRFTEKEQIKASRILLPLKPDATDAEKKAALKQAKEIRAKAAAANADFAAIATQSSKGPEAQRGGDLGQIVRGRFSPEFDNAAFALEANAVSDVIETKQGYEIIKVFEKKPERQRPIDEVKDSIKNSLLARKRNEKRREVLRTLKTDAKVEQLVKFEPVPMAPGAPGMPQVARPGLDRPIVKPAAEGGEPADAQAPQPEGNPANPTTPSTQPESPEK